MAGKYDDLANLVRREADADAALVLVVNGSRGHGISLSSQPSAHASVVASLPARLRAIADVLEAQGSQAGETVTYPDFPKGD